MLAALVLPMTLLGCTALAPSESTLPAGAIALEAPAVFRTWFARTEGCSGLSGDFSTVQFYVIPGVDAFPTPEGNKVGLWSRVGKIHRIVIAGNYQNHEMVVSHEMLHSLLSREGHPEDYFVRKCHLTWESWRLATRN
jgi:hypothetical protein